MSLLLEALKKAAEDKKRQAEGLAVESNAHDIETSGVHTRSMRGENIDDWSLIDVESNTQNEIEDLPETKLNIRREDDFKIENISLAQSLQKQTPRYQGSPEKASQVFIGSAGNTQKKKKTVLMTSLVVSLGVFVGLFAYDYITAIADERSAKYRPIRSQFDTKNLAQNPAGQNSNPENTVVSAETENNEASSNPVVQQTPVKTAVKSTNDAPARKRLSIAKQISSETIHDTLMQGYNAYERGEYANAKNAYQRVMEKESNNRDALLGLAAIAMVEKNFVVADDYYSELLKLDPRDSIAIAATNNLLSMNNQSSNNLDRETQLKILLKQKPNSHELHFALANVYATQQQWANAQMHYLNAYHLDNQNADYAYNLAVCLDHLGQQPSALQLYQTAVALSSHRSAIFNAIEVNDRIFVLQASITPQ